MQNRNDNYFRLDKLCILTRNYFENCYRKKRVYVCTIFVFLSCPKKIKLPSGLTEL